MRRWIDASDSEDDDEVRAPIRTAKDKKWDTINAISATITNMLKTKDWNRLQDGMTTPVCVTAYAYLLALFVNMLNVVRIYVSIRVLMVHACM